GNSPFRKPALGLPHGGLEHRSEWRRQPPRRFARLARQIAPRCKLCAPAAYPPRRFFAVAPVALSEARSSRPELLAIWPETGAHSHCRSTHHVPPRLVRPAPDNYTPLPPERPAPRSVA